MPANFTSREIHFAGMARSHKCPAPASFTHPNKNAPNGVGAFCCCRPGQAAMQPLSLFIAFFSS